MNEEVGQRGGVLDRRAVQDTIHRGKWRYSGLPCYLSHSIDWVVWTFPVILSAERYVKSVNGVLAMILDSSLRCATFRMTE